MAFWISQENIALNLRYLYLFLGKKEKSPMEGVVIYGGFILWESLGVILESRRAIGERIPKEREIDGTEWKGWK